MNADVDTGAFVRVLDRDETILKPRESDQARLDAKKFQTIGGVTWVGDDDQEKIFGTSWMDNLFGSKGDD